MTSTQTNYDEQVRVLQERFPQASSEKLMRHLRRYDGDADKVWYPIFLL